MASALQRRFVISIRCSTSAANGRKENSQRWNLRKIRLGLAASKTRKTSRVFNAKPIFETSRTFHVRLFSYGGFAALFKTNIGYNFACSGNAAAAMTRKHRSTPCREKFPCRRGTGQNSLNNSWFGTNNSWFAALFIPDFCHYLLICGRKIPITNLLANCIDKKGTLIKDRHDNIEAPPTINVVKYRFGSGPETMINLDSNICSGFESSSEREWLETNGIGSYASSTVSGAHSRRYHGLLVAATRPPLGRMVLLSKFEETVILGGQRFELSCNQYPGKIYPDGYKFIKEFRLDPFPVWTFDVNGVEIEKSVFMIYGENSTVCQWKIRSEISNLKSEIELCPLLAFRDHHHLRHEDAEFKGGYEAGRNLITIKPYAEMPTLYFAHNAESIEPQGHWYRNFEYAIEHERGFDFHEDLFQPFRLRFDLAADARVVASTEVKNVGELEAFERAEIKRRREIVNIAGATGDFSSQLALAADQFIVSRGSGKSVIAGYHWFSDWGRDTMIALNGLTLATNRPEIAKSILTEFSKHISEGMLPNRFPDAGETPEYNTVDATLWYFEAIRAYAVKTGDNDFVRDVLFEKLIEIIDWHIRGTRYQIHIDTDGLLFAGEPGVQLTWMDAKVGDWVVTPRTGKAVEIQALWYNALCIMAEFAGKFGDTERQTNYFSMAETAKGSFNGQFWNDAENCLFDVVNGGERDASVRPNQIFAVSLPHTMLGAEKARKVIEKAEKELLTFVGLRSLSPNDPRYVSSYTGSPLERDGSYHQGTVWGWLIGPYVEAYLKVNSNSLNSKVRAREIINNFKTHITEATVGQVSEIYDAVPPHTARGCAAQAWSVAELLRVSAMISESGREQAVLTFNF